MACLSLQITSIRPATLAVAAMVSANVSVTPMSASGLSVTPSASAVLKLQAHPFLQLAVSPLRQASLQVTPVIDGDESDPDETGKAQLSVTPIEQAALSVMVSEPVALHVRPVPATAAIALTPAPQLGVGLTHAPHAVLHVDATRQALLWIGEVCCIGDGTLTVLAASDGPLRTKDGGYILLDPARETD